MRELLWTKENCFVFVFLVGGILGLVWSVVRRIKAVQVDGKVVEDSKDLWYSIILLLLGLLSIFFLTI